jgi:OOP family OmpA-OmpF porin
MNMKTSVAVLAAIASLSAQTAMAHEGGKANAAYVGDGRSGHLVTDSSGKCVRTSSWSEELALSECSGGQAPKKVAKTEPEAAPAAVAAPVAKPAPKAEAKSEKVTLKAGALFDVSKADLKPAGKSELDALVNKIQDSNTQVEQITVTGYTDASGKSAHNQKLSERRAEAVKAYLVSKGLSADHIVTKGAGDANPVASNKTAAGRSQNRRVEIDIKAQRTTSPAN